MIGASYTVVKQPLDVTALDTLEILGVFVLITLAFGVIKLLIDITLDK